SPRCWPPRTGTNSSLADSLIALNCRGHSVTYEPGKVYARPRSGAAPGWAASHGHRASRLPFAGPATRRITPCPAGRGNQEITVHRSRATSVQEASSRDVTPRLLRSITPKQVNTPRRHPLEECG